MFELKPSQASADSDEENFGINGVSRPNIPDDEIAQLSPADRIPFLRRSVAGPIVFTHGFGIEGQLLFHWIVGRNLDIDVVALDTGRLFPETYELWERTERRYGRRIRAIYPDHVEVERMVAKQGINGFYDSKEARETCCNVRKTRPIDVALENAAGWITGLRADQNANRRNGGLVSFDATRRLSSSIRCTTGNARRCWPRWQRTTFQSTAYTARASPRSAARPARAPSRVANRNAMVAGGGKTMAAANAACICRAKSALT